MLTPYAGCWGSFALRGLSLVLFGVVQLALPGMAAESAIPMLGVVLLVSGANAASLGLRLRPSGAASWLLLEGGVSLLTGVVAFAHPQSSVLAAAGPVAVLAALNGACQLGLAWRARSGPYGAWPIAGAGLAWIGFALMLAWQPFATPGQTMATGGAAGLMLGAVLSAVAANLQRAVSRRSEEPFTVKRVRPVIIP